MFRPLLALATSIGAAIGVLHDTASAQAGVTLTTQARPFAERFLVQLDGGNIPQAYEMLSRTVRAAYPLANLQQASARRQTKGGVRRSVVRIRETRPSGTVTIASQMRPARRPTANLPSIVIVCFVETPMANFKSVSYTSVTVSGRPDAGGMAIENFQTTSEPSSACR